MRKQRPYETVLGIDSSSNVIVCLNFVIALGFTMSREFYARSLKNGKKSGGFLIESGNSVFEPTVTTGQISCYVTLWLFFFFFFFFLFFFLFYSLLRFPVFGMY